MSAEVLRGHPPRRGRSYQGWRRWLVAVEEQEPVPRKIATYRLLLDDAQMAFRKAQDGRQDDNIELMQRVMDRLIYMLDVADRIEQDDEEDIEVLLNTIH